MSEEIRNRTEIIADLVEARKNIYDLEKEIERLLTLLHEHRHEAAENAKLLTQQDLEIERLRAVIQGEIDWLSNHPSPDVYGYWDKIYARVGELKQVLKGEK